MRYYLVSLVDQQTRSYVRDLQRSFSKYKRSLQFSDLDSLAFSYKYLGKDLSPETIAAIAAQLRELIATAPLRTFNYKLTQPVLGTKLEYQPNVARMELVRTPELNELFRLLQNAVTNLGLNAVVQRKDVNSLLGVIKLAEITTNVSVDARLAIAKQFKHYPAPPALLVNNLALICKYTVNQRPKTRLIELLPLN